MTTTLYTLNMQGENVEELVNSVMDRESSLGPKTLCLRTHCTRSK